MVQLFFYLTAIFVSRKAGLTVEICSLSSTGEFESIHTLRGHLHQIYGIVFSPAGDLVVTSGLDSGIRVWNTLTGTCIALLQDHNSSVSRLRAVKGVSRQSCFPFNSTSPLREPSDDDRSWTLVTASVSGSIVSYEVSPSDSPSEPQYSPFFPSPAQTQPHPSSSFSFQTMYTIQAHNAPLTFIRTDGEFILSSATDGHVKVWDLHSGAGGRDCYPPVKPSSSASGRMLSLNNGNKVYDIAFLSSPAGRLGVVGRRQVASGASAEEASQSQGGILVVVVKEGEQTMVHFWSMRGSP